MRFLSNFGCKIIFMRSVNFWRQQDSNSLFKGSIGHVNSYCKWPIEITRQTVRLAATDSFTRVFIQLLCRLLKS